MTDKIAQSLKAQFAKHRIVFWYDTNRDMRDTYDALALDGVSKLEISNNEFGLKYRILNQEPETKFLLYKAGPKPDLPIDNWLLDVELAQGHFRTDRVQTWLVELGLGVQAGDVLKQHEAFFHRSPKRLDALKAALREDHSPRAIRLAMLGVCVGGHGRIDDIVERLLGGLGAGKLDKPWKLIERCALVDALWSHLANAYGYETETPSIEDFAITLFKSCYLRELGEACALNSEALVFFNRWKSNKHHAQAFETLSERYAEPLGIATDVEERDFRALIEIDHFELVERVILRHLVHEVAGKTMPLREVERWVGKRRRLHWHDREGYAHLYSAVEYAARFFDQLNALHVGMDSLSDGVRQYAESGHVIDQLYRKFIYHARKSGQAGLLGKLSEAVEDFYSNAFLLNLNDRWQVWVDQAERWAAEGILLQRNFFDRVVRPLRDRNIKVCVLISDAMRYEVGEELAAKVRGLDRFDADLAPALSMLPSYTQLGMASLLPNSELTVDEKTLAYVDGQSSQGRENRQKILTAARPGDRCRAVKFEELMGYGGDEAKALIRDLDILYIYHDRIDAIGDKPATESGVFEAVEDTFDDLLKAVRKLMSANAKRVIVTADHGFIYQHRGLEESDYSSANVDGEEVQSRHRRFVLGKGLTEDPALRKFTAAQLGLAGEMDVSIPKSINRLRRSGSGSRFVHGGAALQEVVIPVLTITKSRTSDVAAVEVEVIDGGKVITTNQHSVRLYQAEAVTEKRQARRLRGGIYSKVGELLSDRHELTFEAISDNPRDRETSVRFLLSQAAEECNGQEVTLRLEEPVEGTSHYKEYKTSRFTLRRNIATDFDF